MAERINELLNVLLEDYAGDRVAAAGMFAYIMLRCRDNPRLFQLALAIARRLIGRGMKPSKRTGDVAIKLARKIDPKMAEMNTDEEDQFLADQIDAWWIHRG